MAKRVDRVGREAGIFVAIAGVGLGADEVQMRERLIGDVVGHQAERRAEMELEAAVVANERARREVAAAAAPGRARFELEAVTFEQRGEDLDTDGERL